MATLASDEILGMFLGIGILLAATRLTGECARTIRQPPIVGEIIAGILLGPTLFGSLAPGWANFLFPMTGAGSLILDGLTTLSVSLFLLVAGMEVNLSAIWRQGKVTIVVSIAGLLFPFALGFMAAWYAPDLLGLEKGGDPFWFALFVATALSITALPVITRILRDLGLFHHDLGMIIVAAAVFDDLIGWILFAMILGAIGSSGGRRPDVGFTILMIAGFAALMLTVGRLAIHHALPWVKTHTFGSGGVLSFSLVLGLLGAAFTEWIGVHAIFGSFLVGVAIGDSPNLNEEVRRIIREFISFFFAPLFFGSIGLRVDFTAQFDVGLVIALFILAVFGKMAGCGLGARWAGMGWREAWAIGSGMIAKGTMGIILGILALQHGLIAERMFVAIVVVSLLTSVISGPMIQLFLGRPQIHRS